MKRLSTSFPVGDTPLDEYPRPQMVRAQWQNLNGLWQYAVTESPEQPAVWQGGIRVPFAPESALSGVEKPVLPGQTLWYFRTFSINGYDAAKRTLLHFGAVDYACTVFVNGREAGGHTGGYCPFTLDITSFVRAAENELTVAVTDDTDKGDAPRGKQVLHPKGIWYTAVTGIWQTVWLERVPEKYIKEVDEKRTSFHKYCTDTVWGDAKEYQLCLDTGKIGFEKTAELIMNYINAKKES